jgi:hypothetical protein
MGQYKLNGCSERQHRPLFLEDENIFKNRLRRYGFYSNSAPYQWSRFLSCIFKGGFFFLNVGILVRSVGTGKLFVLDFLYKLSPYSCHTQLAIFKCPYLYHKFSMTLVL